MTALAPKTNGRPRVVPPPNPPRSLAEAVLAVQAAAPKLRRNEPGQIQNRTYMYTTISAVKEDIGPLLIENGLLWRTQPTDNERGEPALRYRMTHIPSGEEDEGTVTLKGVCDSQSFGSATTYMRRYVLIAYLDLVPAEDDDGASASMPTGQPPVDRYAEAAETHAQLEADRQPSARPAQRSERPITANQRTKLLIPRAQKAGLSDGEFANVLLTAGGDEPRQWRNEDHATQTLSRLLDRCPARLKDQVLEGIAQAAAAKASA